MDLKIKKEKEIDSETKYIEDVTSLWSDSTINKSQLDGETDYLLTSKEALCESVDIKEENNTELDAQPMAAVAVDSSQEPAPEFSSACTPIGDGFAQLHLIPGYNLIFIKEEDVEQEEEGNPVQNEQIWPSSETASATKAGGLNPHSISPIETCTESSVAGKKTKLYSCAQCNYETPRLNNLKAHIRTHTGEKPFSCKFCDYKFNHSSHLKSHLRIHTGEKPFSCEFCEYKSARSNALKRHLKTHTGETRFICKFCDYKCDHSSNLKLHLRTHTGEKKPFGCKFCDYRCDSSSHLKSHLRTHTGETHFSCEFCDYKSARSTDLKRHLRTHTGETRIICEFCDYKCDHSSNLKRHLRTHTGQTTSS